MCDHPSETGPCEAAMQKYYYDSDAGYCKTFIYGGCEGNENNFDTAEQCVEACDKKGSHVWQFFKNYFDLTLPISRVFATHAYSLSACLKHNSSQSYVFMSDSRNYF